MRASTTSSPIEPISFDLDLERSLLGRILMPRDGVTVDLAQLRPFYFSTPRHKIILMAVTALHRASVPVDLFTLRDWLRENGKLESSGGMRYLSGLVNDPVTNTEWCLWRLRSLAARRQIFRIAEKLSNGEWTADDAAGQTRLTHLHRRLGTLVAEQISQSSESSARLRRLDLIKTLKEPPTDLPWVIQGWLMSRDLICLAGEPKVGKSWLALDLAFALSGGTPFLGSLEVERGPFRVLYVDEENNPALIAQRIRKLAAGSGISAESSPLSRLAYLSENSLNLDNDGHKQALMREVDHFTPDWIILDSLIRFHRREENSNAAMAEFRANVLKPLADKGCGVILIHHLSKPDNTRRGGLSHRVRGASDIIAFVDQLWTLEQSRDGTRTLRHEKSRWAESAPPSRFEIQNLPGESGVRLVAAEASDTSLEIVLGLLREGESEGATRGQIRAALKSRGFKADDKLASRHLKALSNSGSLAKRKEGKEMRYWLSEFAPAAALPLIALGTEAEPGRNGGALDGTTELGS